MQGIVFFCVVLGVVTKLPQTACLNGPKQKKVTVNLANPVHFAWGMGLCNDAGDDSKRKRMHSITGTSIILVVRIFISLMVDCAQPVRSIIVRILQSTRTPGASGADKISLATARLSDT